MQNSADEIKKLRQSKRDIDKEIKRIKEAEKLQASLSKWKEITDLKNKIYNQIKSNDVAKSWSLKRLMAMQDYYTMQHPTNSKLKTSDENTQWVQDYIKNGGAKSKLIETANKSRPVAWSKMNPKRGRKTKTSSSSTSKTATPIRRQTG